MIILYVRLGQQENIIGHYYVKTKKYPFCLNIIYLVREHIIFPDDFALTIPKILVLYYGH